MSLTNIQYNDIVNTITFIRHGEHQEGELFNGLSSIGCAEMRVLEIDRSKELLGVAPNMPRFIGSTALALDPSIEDAKLEYVSEQMILEGRIRINDQLDYKDPSLNEDFMNAMFEAYEEGRNLRFFVEESEKYMGDISKYSSMARAIGLSILANFSENQLICAREFFVPSFRAKISDIASGVDVMNDYVEWYESCRELNPNARKDLVVILHDDDEYYLKDDFGEIYFNEDHIRSHII